MKVRRNITLSPSTFKFIVGQAKKEGRNFSNMLDTIVKRYAKDQKKRK